MVVIAENEKISSDVEQVKKMLERKEELRINMRVSNFSMRREVEGKVVKDWEGGQC